MVPLYAARIEDLGPGDFVRVDCAACEHTALLAPTFLSRLGLNPRVRVHERDALALERAEDTAL